MSAETETCPVMVFGDRDYTGHKCGRRVKSDGLCGLHAGAIERRLAKEEADRRTRAEAQVIVDRLAVHGVRAWASATGPRLSISAEALADLLDGER